MSRRIRGGAASLVGFMVVVAVLCAASVAAAQVCGDGAITAPETCDDANILPGDGCSATCTVEPGWSCVPSLYASGVNPAGAALAAGSVDPHWTWSSNANGTGAVPAIVIRHGAWANLPPGNWVSTDASFGAAVPGADTYWFQTVYLPPAAIGTLKFDVAVAADNEAEVFINGVSYGSVVGFGSATVISVPVSAFVAGQNAVRIRLREYVVGTPRGILMYPGGGGILSQCAKGCTTDGDCDDANECTTDTCIAGACDHASATAGTTCSLGVCTEALPISKCVVCADTVSGNGTDLGCSTATPLCDESGTTRVCVQCIVQGDCSSPQVCQSGACVTLPPDLGPPDLGPDLGRDAGTPDLLVPDLAAPDLAAPDLAEPDRGTSDARRPDASRPDASRPDAGRRDVSDPLPPDARVDAPRPDAGSRDGGGPEASAPVDSSAERSSSLEPPSPPTKPTTNEGGCDCATGGGASTQGGACLGLTLLALALWCRRRRRG